MEKPQQAYWAVIPAEIRRDDRLPANAKLLYGDLSALTYETGYCYAGNEYLMGLYGWSDRTVQRLIKALEDQGYIRIEMVPGKERRIFCGVRYAGKTPDKNVGGRRQKSRGTPDNFVGPNNVDIDSDNCAPHTPQGGRRRRKEPRKAPDWKPERFAGLWDYYPKKGRQNKQDAMNAWDDLRPSDELIDTMARALQKLKNTDLWKRGKGIPYVGTFLRNARWEDAEELDTPDETPGGETYEDRRLL